MTIELGLILPTSTPDPERPILGDVRAAARLAEEVGVESVWSTDHLVASAPMLDSTVALATAAAVTDRVRRDAARAAARRLGGEAGDEPAVRLR